MKERTCSIRLPIKKISHKPLPITKSMARHPPEDTSKYIKNSCSTSLQLPSFTPYSTPKYPFQPLDSYPHYFYNYWVTKKDLIKPLK